MNKLSFNNTPEWIVLSEQDSEIVLARKDSSDLIVKIRSVPFFGQYSDYNDLYEEFLHRVKSDAIILDSVLDVVDTNSELWRMNNYVCTGTEEKYRSFFYRIFDHFYTVVEMLTGSDKVAIHFNHYINEIVPQIDYGVTIDRNPLKVGGKIFSVKTPSTFRYSLTSKDDHLVFLGENKYLLVNVCNPAQDLREFVINKIQESRTGIDGCEIQYESHGSGPNFEYERYVVRSEDGRCSFGTYFKNVSNTVTVVSFLFEYGCKSTDISSLLVLEGGDD